MIKALGIKPRKTITRSQAAFVTALRGHNKALKSLSKAIRRIHYGP